MNYYNENGQFAAAWLRELIKAGHISQGEVDERSIEDVVPTDLRGFRQCHFFAGIGVWSYALRQAGWPDDREVWTGSCPCQPFSAAGKRGGTTDERHLWPSLFHLLANNRPNTFFGEQVASKDGLGWFETVSADLENASYTLGYVDASAAGFGAPHIRQRLYFVADSRSQSRDSVGPVDNSTDPRHDYAGKCNGRSSLLAARLKQPITSSFWSAFDRLPCIDGKARPVEPGTFPLAHGAPARVGRLRGYGNALVAPQAQAFIEAFLETQVLSETK